MGIASGDFDLDGDEDLFVTNIVGETSVLYVNDGHGNFVDARVKSGLAALTAAFTGFGTDWIDYDNDGDIDIVVTNNNGPVRLLLNQLGAANHWLQIRLEQRPSNRFGIGSWIRVDRAGRPTLWRRVRTDGSYLSASDVRAHFGLGSSADISSVVVQWPDGELERWTAVKGDRLIVLRRGTGQR